jgi:hypothetical protein
MYIDVFINTIFFQVDLLTLLFSRFVLLNNQQFKISIRFSNKERKNVDNNVFFRNFELLAVMILILSIFIV